jgi:DNA-binding winged helix-turn-helix (wHTH) protein
VQVSFGKFRLDLDARQLFQGTEPIRISPKAFLLLKLLLERRPEARSKAELHAAI